MRFHTLNWNLEELEYWKILRSDQPYPLSLSEACCTIYQFGNLPQFFGSFHTELSESEFLVVVWAIERRIDSPVRFSIHVDIPSHKHVWVTLYRP